MADEPSGWEELRRNNPELRIPQAAFEGGVDEFTQGAAGAGLSPEEAERVGRSHFGELLPRNYREIHRRVRQEQDLGREREQVAGLEESSGHHFLRHLPLGSIFQIPENLQADRARERYRAGSATPEDLRRIAEHEQLDRARSEQNQHAEALAGIPGMVVETWMGGRLLGAAGAFAGRAAQGTSLAGRAGRFAAATALAPSLYLDQAAQRNQEQGRANTYDWQGFPAAVVHAALTMGVMGSLHSLGDAITTAGVRGAAARFIARTATGMTEMHGFIEPLADAVSYFMPQAYRLSTEYGPMTNAFRGEWGKAWQQFSVGLTTMGAFAALHGLQNPAHAAQGAINQLHQQGTSQQQAGQALSTIMASPAAAGRIAQTAPQGSMVQQFAGQIQQLFQVAVQTQKPIRQAPAAEQRTGLPPNLRPTEQAPVPPVPPVPTKRRADPTQRWNDTGTRFGSDEAGRPSVSTRSGNRYSLDVTSDANGGIVRVRDAKGNLLKDTYYGFTKNADGSYSGDVKINADHQGQGLQKALYDWVTRNVGPVSPQTNPKSFGQTAQGEAFWAKNKELKPATVTAEPTTTTAPAEPAAPPEPPAPAPSKTLSRLERMRANTQAAATGMKPVETPPIANSTPEPVRQQAKAQVERETQVATARGNLERLRRGEDVSTDELHHAIRTFNLSTVEKNALFRRLQGETQADIAKSQGVTPSAIQKAEARAVAKAGLSRSMFMTEQANKAVLKESMPTTAETSAKEGFRQEGGMIQEPEARLEALHQQVEQMLDKAIESGEPINMAAVEALYRAGHQEIESARQSIPDHARDTPSVRGEFEQSVQSGFQAGSTPVESETGAGVRGGPEANGPAGERRPGVAADVPADAPASTQRRGTSADQLGESAPPEKKGLLKQLTEAAGEFRSNEEGTFRYDQFLQDFHDLMLDRLGPAIRLTKAALATGAYHLVGTGRDLMTVLQGLTNADKPVALEYRDKGIWALIKGHKVTIGKPLQEILKPLAQADAAPIDGVVKTMAGHWFEKSSTPSNFDVFAVARSIIDEQARGSPLVSLTRFQEARAVMAHFQADPAFVARASAVHDSLIQNVYNASLLARASPDVHNITPQEAARFVAEHPYYIDARRGLEENEYKQTGKGHREHMAGSIKSREGESDRVIYPPLQTSQLRLAETARVVNEQLRRNAYEETLSTPRMQAWSDQLPSGAQPDPRAQAWYWKDAQGQERVRIIKDKSLYDLMANIQGYDRAFVQLFNAASQIPGMHTLTQGVKLGATTLSLGFQLFRNSIKDAYTFFSNTRSQASVKDLPMAYAKMYKAEWDVFTSGASKNEIFNTLKELRGEEMRAFAFQQGGTGLGRIKTVADFGRQVLRIAGAGELAPRALEMQTRLKELGWSPERLAQERAAARQQQAQGGYYVEPLPFYQGLEVSKAGREATVDFSRMGILGAEINKIVPFFNPAVQGVWKELTNWRQNPRGASVALASFLAAKIAHWAMFHDEEWYKEQSPYDRFNNFVVPYQGSFYRFPGPRDSAIPIGGATITMLDRIAGHRPDWAGLFHESYGAMLPPFPLPVPAMLAWQIGTNKNWMGGQIVPERDQRLPSSYNLMHHQLPYGVQQLTGGRGEASLRGLTGLNLEVRNNTRSLNEYYDELHGLEKDRALAQRQGRTFAQEARYQQLHSIQGALSDMNRTYRTSKDPVQQQRIRRQQTRLAASVVR